MGDELIRKLHPKFKEEIGELLESDVPSERELAGKLYEMLDELLRKKRENSPHQHEHPLKGDKLKGIKYLKKKKNEFSIRMYFTLVKNVLWMLALINKRRDDLEKGEEKMLKQRLREVRKGECK